MHMWALFWFFTSTFISHHVLTLNRVVFKWIYILNCTVCIWYLDKTYLIWRFDLWLHQIFAHTGYPKSLINLMDLKVVKSKQKIIVSHLSLSLSPHPWYTQCKKIFLQKFGYQTWLIKTYISELKTEMRNYK